MIFPIITITGGSCSGKTTFVQGFKNATVISVDSFYKDISELAPDSEGRYDFDTPEAVDLDACKKAVEGLSKGESVIVPVYDYVTMKRTGNKTIDPPTTVNALIILEGIFALYPPLDELGVLRVFIEAPPEIRIARRIKRDVEKGRNATETLKWFVKVEEGHQKFIEPTKLSANLIIPFSHSPIVFSS
jgi:uridine kinase